MDAAKETCAICWGTMNPGDGQARFTSECSHVFHFSCIAHNVQHGNHICPTCRSPWTNLPTQFLPTSNSSPLNPRQPPSFFPLTPLEFTDDEPLLSPAPQEGSTSSEQPCHQRSMTVKALPEYPALSRSDRSDSFAVLVGIRAPTLSPEASDRPGTRAPLDLVAVLDVSGSMGGGKLQLLKQAVNFVVDNLGPADRLSIVTFSTSAQRVTPLKRMTNEGRANMAQAVSSLRATGSTNIIAGLRMAMQVLDQRREKNPVASIILLSDGQDNQNGYGSEGFLRVLSQVPITVGGRTQNPNDVVPVPVHTFGFGLDHDAAALHAVAERSDGTFSFIGSIEVIQDAFAQCLGGLLSVVAQEVEIRVQCGSSRVQIQSISSGRYRNTIDNSYEQHHGVIYVGDLYADEEKQFLVYLAVPEETTSVTTSLLLEVKCSYKDPLLDEIVMPETKRVEICRPSADEMSEADRQVNLEVDRERNRVSVAEAIAQAQAMAERGELERARSILGQRRARLQSSVSAQVGDSVCAWLEGEVIEVEAMMSNRTRYESGGRAYALSKKSSHMNQRASTQAVHVPLQQRRARLATRAAMPLSESAAVSFSAPAEGKAATPPEGMGYQTPFMRQMVTKSQMLRQPATPKEEATGSSNSSQP